MRKVVLISLAVVILGGTFVILKPKPVKSPPSQSEATSTSQIPNKLFELVVTDRKLIKGPDTIKVSEGDEVTIKVTINEDEELHLHGYDADVDLQKDVPAELHFTAKLTGNFPYELEKSKIELGSVQVQPK